MQLKSQALAAAKLIILALALAPSNTVPAQGQSLTTSVRARFNLEAPASAPFPSNWFTVADPRHNTGLRVNLPKPDCAVRPSDCEDLDVINTLDGFNLQPRLSIPFDGPIDLTTVSSRTVFLVNLGSTMPRVARGSRVVGINQIVWDPATNTLHAQADELLDQHTRYALIVTSGVRDASGAPVQATTGFRRFVLASPFELFFRDKALDCQFGQDCRLHEYRRGLSDALRLARGIGDGEIVSASLFTTQSATAILEKMRDQIKATTPAPAEFHLGAGGERTVFNLNAVSGITWNQQTGANPARFTALDLNLSGLRMIPGAVGQIAFGKYRAPEYLVHPGEFIPPVGTRYGAPVVQNTIEIYFNLYLPASPKPAAGWPVAIYGHGTGGNKNGRLSLPAPPIPFDSLAVAATMASHGIATIAINVNGHGFGPLGTLTVNQTGGGSLTFPAGGRGIDQNRDGQIGNQEGNEAAAPRRLHFVRDGLLQTAADLIALVRVIEAGVDVEGDGTPDLDPGRIYYFGHSLGGMYGTDFVAVEPNVRAAVFNVPASSVFENRRLGPAARSGLGALLAARQPSLINSPGLTQLGGLPVAPPHFNENLPLRDQPPVINTVAGAMEIQEWGDRVIWAGQAANPIAWSPHLRHRPLPGVPAKSVIVQFAYGDPISPNLNTTALLRAGALADRATLYRTDLAFAENAAARVNPHGFMLMVGSPVPLLVAIARGTQEQIAVFFASDGATVIHPEPSRFFETPLIGPLPEQLNYIP